MKHVNSWSSWGQNNTLQRRERNLNSIDLIFKKKEKLIYWEVILRDWEYQKGGRNKKIFKKCS